MRFRHIPQETARFVSEHRVLTTLGITTLALTGFVESQFANGSILRLLDLTAAGMLAIPTWEIPVQHGLTELLSTLEGAREVARWIAIDGGIALVAGLLHKSIGRVLNEARQERKRLGIEPLSEREGVSDVLIGPPDVISDFAQTIVTTRGKTKGKKIVGIHIGDSVPPAYGQEIDHHIKVGSSSEIVGRFAPVAKHAISTIEASGIDRADNITIFCINPDNALHYGGFGAEISSDFPSTLIKRIPPEKIKDKTINVILPDERYLGRTTPMEKELRALADKLHFNLHISTPEQLVMAKVTDRLDSISASKEKGDPLNILLVGQGSEPKDELMLLNFKSALDHLKIGDRRIEVSLVTQKRLAEKTIDGTVTPDKAQQILADLIRKTDLVLCYGDTDFGTSSLVRLLITQGIDVSKILAFVERTGMSFDYEGETLLGIPAENVFSIYQALLNDLPNR